MRLRTLEDYAEQCGLLSLPLSLNVVHRERWRAVVAAERTVAERTPIVPQVYVIGRMVQADPDWLWSEDRIVLSREASVYLEEREYTNAKGGDFGRQYREILRELDRAWTTLYGRRSAVHGALMRTFYAWILHPAAAAVGKLAAGGGPRDEWRYLSFARYFWRIRDFRRKTLPLLLTPAALLRPPQSIPPAQEDRSRARLHGAIAERLISARGAWVEVMVENVGRSTLSFARPHYAALYANGATRIAARRSRIGCSTRRSTQPFDRGAHDASSNSSRCRSPAPMS